MSEHNPRRQAESAVDRLLDDSGFPHGSDVRDELLELRSLADTAPLPSDAVRALMVGDAPTAKLTTAEGASAVQELPTAVLTTVGSTLGLHADETPAGAKAPTTAQAPTTALPVKDELAARRRKRRAAIAGLAVAAALGGGATAAAAQEGGIPATIQHLGSAVGSMVSQFTPAPAPVQKHPAVPPTSGVQPAPAAPQSTEGAVPTEEGKPGKSGSVPSQTGKVPAAEVSQPPKDQGNAGKVPLPAPPVTPPSLGEPSLPPSLRPSTLPETLPSHLIPEVPKAPGGPAK
ncbi:hypothetical protein [Paenarthrobacter sp. NPDC090522]|uniref:hypothetical protein n=1 Tax=Paenarthrobacter sp. NPDC090522 TaxID=3364383 RepID=UPI003818BCB6